MLATSLKDKEVIEQAGKLIGKVKDGTIDDKTWQVTSLEVELQGDVAKEFHVKKTFGSSSIPLNTTLVGAVGDKIVLKVSTKEVGQSISGVQEQK